MKLTPAENILYRAVAGVFNHPRKTHKELTNKRASVMLAGNLEGELEVIADTGLLNWAFIPCFQQMFHDTNALPMRMHSTYQMVLDFLVYVHEARIQVMSGGEDLTMLAVLRGGEAVPYHGMFRARTLRFALREALEAEKYNTDAISGNSVVAAMENHGYLFQSEGEGSNSSNAEAAIDGILSSFRRWLSEIENYQDHHVVVDCFLRALQDEGLEIVEGQQS